jgi:cytochrome c556
MSLSRMAAAATFLLIVGCGGPETSQANNAQANISATARPPNAASASAVQAGSAASPVNIHAVMHERHEGMRSIGKANKAIRDTLQASAPDLAVIRSSAAQISDLSRKASGWFPSGTGPEAGKTGAKPGIWQNPQDFSSKLSAFQKAAPAFQTAAGTGDLDAIRARLADLGQTCKACHDKYRTDMHHH